MQPSRLTEFITLVRERFEDAARDGEAPVLVTSAGIRPFVRGIVERFRAQTPVHVAGGNPPAGRGSRPSAASDPGRHLLSSALEIIAFFDDPGGCRDRAIRAHAGC